MQHFLSTAALLAFAALSTASPVRHHKSRPHATFHLDQVSVGTVLKSGPISMMKAYNKFAKVGAVVPSDVQSAAAAAQSGSVTATPEQYDQDYTCPVSLGGQTLMLDFDTGSSDLWVLSTLTPHSESAGHTLYNVGEDGSNLLSGESWSLNYGDGSGAAGIVYADKVVIGSVTATSQAVEAATSVSLEFTQDVGTDGLLGLGFSSINSVVPTAQTTFFDNVKSTLAAALFTVDLRKGQPGSYDFGYIDPSKYTGSISYVSVDSSQGFWNFTAGGYAVGTGSTSGSIGSGIADTGTSLLYLPTAVIVAYYHDVSGASYDSTQGGYTFDCSATLPDFQVEIGSGTFTVPGSYINYSPASGTKCFGGIQDDAGIGFSIFGDIFLKAVYAIFDQTQSSPRLGFAAQ